MIDATVPCSKCQSQGLIKSYFHVQNGVCFQCDGKGFVYTDEFDRAFGVGKTFVGLSFKSFNGKTVKMLQSTKNLAALNKESRPGTTITEISETQARNFFATYGFRTEI